jgi:hypothetical protein
MDGINVIDLDAELEHSFNLSIAKELLQEAGLYLPEDELGRVLAACNGNPWDVPIVLQIVAEVQETMPDFIPKWNL